MKNKRWVLLAAVGLFMFGCASNDRYGSDWTMWDGSGYAAHPFPTGGGYAERLTLPTNVSEMTRIARTVRLFMEILENNLIVDEAKPFTKDEFRMVVYHSLGWGVTDDPDDESYDYTHINVSESQGYGMMIMAYMAGCEPKLNELGYEWICGSGSLKDYYDAMLRTVQDFPSATEIPGRKNTLFAWEMWGYTDTANPQPENKLLGYKKSQDGLKTATFRINADEGVSKTEEWSADSATDGDMDIIYSLLLADKQWGSDGRYNYKAIALKMLNDLFELCVSPGVDTWTLNSLRVCDWASDNPTLTRPSDFMISHLRAYAAAEADPTRWNNVADGIFKVINDVCDPAVAGKNNGLLSDFATFQTDGPDAGRWIAGPKDSLEGETDDTFGYNASRTPWRLGTEYLLHGDSNGLKTNFLDPYLAFMKKKTNNGKNFRRLGPLNLDGTNFAYDDEEAEVEPQLFASMIVVPAAALGDQGMVNALWGVNKTINEDRPDFWGLHKFTEDTYADYINLVIMLTVSGYYWMP
jgi:hypothetical protein